MAGDTEMEDASSPAFVVEVKGEDHTFGNIVRDVMWTHPHVTVAQYTQEMVVPGNQLLIQCQTSGAITPQQGLVESLQITQQIFNAIGDEMDAAVKRHRQKKR